MIGKETSFFMLFVIHAMVKLEKPQSNIVRFITQYPKWELNPHSMRELEFESSASANFAIWA